MSSRALRATTPTGIAILASSSVVVAALVLLVDFDLASKLWLGAGILGIALVAVWSFSKQGALRIRLFDQFVWSLLISHTVIVSRIRDPRVLAQDEGLTPQIAAEIAIWCVCLLYCGARFVASPACLSNLWGPGSRYATLLTVAAICSAVYAASPMITLAWSLKLVAIVASCCTLFDSREPLASAERFMQATYWALVLMLAQFVILGAIAPETALEMSTVTGIWRAGGYLLPATKLSAVAGMVVLLSLIDILSHRNRFLGKTIFVFSGFLMLASLGRGGMLATLVAVLLALASFKRTRWVIWLSSAAGIVFLAFPRLFGIAWDILSRRQQMSQLADLTGRVPLWENAIELIQLKPLLGWGYVSGGRIAFLQIYSWWAAPHAHNAFLEMLLDLGILGFSLLLLLMWNTSKHSITRLRVRKAPFDKAPAALLSLQVLCLIIFLSIEGLLEAGFSGAPRFETMILFGCAFAADAIRRLPPAKQE